MIAPSICISFSLSFSLFLVRRSRTLYSYFHSLTLWQLSGILFSDQLQHLVSNCEGHIVPWELMTERATQFYCVEYTAPARFGGRRRRHGCNAHWMHCSSNLWDSPWINLTLNLVPECVGQTKWLIWCDPAGGKVKSSWYLTMAVIVFHTHYSHHSRF